MGAVYARPEYLNSHAWQWMHGLWIGASPAKAGAARQDPIRLELEVATVVARLRPPPGPPAADLLGLCTGMEADLVLGGRLRL